VLNSARGRMAYAQRPRLAAQRILPAREHSVGSVVAVRRTCKHAFVTALDDPRFTSLPSTPDVRERAVEPTVGALHVVNGQRE